MDARFQVGALHHDSGSVSLGINSTSMIALRDSQRGHARAGTISREKVLSCNRCNSATEIWRLASGEAVRV